MNFNFESDKPDNLEEALEIHKLMKKNIPESAGFSIEPTRLSREEDRREKARELFKDKELINFIQNKPELVNKILELQKILAY